MRVELRSTNVRRRGSRDAPNRPTLARSFGTALSSHIVLASSERPSEVSRDGLRVRLQHLHHRSHDHAVDLDGDDQSTSCRASRWVRLGSGSDGSRARAAATSSISTHAHLGPGDGIELAGRLNRVFLPRAQPSRRRRRHRVRARRQQRRHNGTITVKGTGWASYAGDNSRLVNNRHHRRTFGTASRPLVAGTRSSTTA
jgi:hypothetical protein